MNSPRMPNKCFKEQYCVRGFVLFLVRDEVYDFPSITCSLLITLPHVDLMSHLNERITHLADLFET